MVSLAEEPREKRMAVEVLVVDDNPLVTQALARMLEQSGFRAAVCHCAEEALLYSQQHEPGAAVVDIHLPDISGLSLASELRRRFGEGRCPIIMLSGDTSMENLRRLPESGASYFISKPFRPEHLIDRLRELARQ